MTSFKPTPTFDELGGEVWRIRRFADDSDKRFSAFNPSIAYSPTEGYVVLMRSSNYFFDPKTGDTVATIGTRIKNRMWLANLDSDWRIIENTMRELDFSKCGNFKRGPEDGRLFWRDGAWHMLSVMREPYVTNDIPRLGTFRFTGTEAELVTLHLDGELQPVEKNWMPTYAVNKNFDFVYSATSIYKSGVGKVHRRDATEIAGNNIRGGSQLWDLGDKYLAIVHQAEVRETLEYSARHFGERRRLVRKYVHQFATYDKTGKLLQLTDTFSFEGANIEFAAGLVISDKDVIVSYGYKDVASYLGRIELSKVLEMLHDC
jgi:hypothetical protein